MIKFIIFILVYLNICSFVAQSMVDTNFGEVGTGIINQPPQVINATIEGELIVGKTVEVTYDFVDEEREGETIFQWYRSTDRVNWEEVTNNRLQQSRLWLRGFIMSGDFLKVSIIPIDQFSLLGQEVIVETSTPIITLTPPTKCISTVENGNDIVLTWEAPEIPEGQKLLEYQINQNDEVIACIADTSSLIHKIVDAEDGFHSYNIRCNYYPGGLSNRVLFSSYTFSNGVLNEQSKHYPNPFSPTSTIQFSLDLSAIIEVKLYNIKGEMIRLLAYKEFAPGQHSLSWDGKDDQGKNVASGFYFYHIITSEGYSKISKIDLIK